MQLTNLVYLKSIYMDGVSFQIERTADKKNKNRESIVNKCFLIFLIR